MSNDRPSQLSALRVIWMALLGFFTVYTVLAFVFDGRNIAPDVAGTLAPILAVLAGVQVLLAVIAPGALFRRAPNYQAVCVIRWALVDSAALYGVVLRILGASFEVAIVFIAAGAGVFVFLRPTEEGEQAFRRALAR